jgi:TonB family protein
MPITQIPFQDPVAPPSDKSQPEQLDLYATQDWEAAYRVLDSRVPHLLVQLQDDLERSRRREAVWISVIVHLLIFIMLWQMKLIEKYVPWHHAVAIAIPANTNKDITYLALPPDAQKITRKPNTNIASDKDRIAMSRHPELDKETHKLVSPPPGAPGMSGPRPAQPTPQVQAQNQSEAPQQAQPPAPRPQFDTNQQARLQAPQQTNNAKNVFNKYAAGGSAGSVIQEAEQAAAANRSAGGGQGGDFGLGTGAKGRQLGALEILSDTQGVDFGPYLQRILEEVRRNWYSLIPESAEMKKGKLAIEFAITKDGKLADMRLVATSNDPALDRAAWGGISASDPFPPLPSEFNGPYLALRFRFYYNPDKSDLE